MNMSFNNRVLVLIFRAWSLTDRETVLGLKGRGASMSWCQQFTYLILSFSGQSSEGLLSPPFDNGEAYVQRRQ